MVQDGRLYGVLGGSGGIRIITTVAQVFLNQFVKKLDALASVATTRVHHQVCPQTLTAITMQSAQWQTFRQIMWKAPTHVLKMQFL